MHAEYTTRTHDNARFERLLVRSAGIAAGLVLIVLIASAFMRLTQAGLGCADWPACYGRVTLPDAAAAPDSAAVTWARVTHRVAAMGVSVLVLFIAYLCWALRARSRRGVWIAAAIVALTIALSILGRWTTGARLPAIALGNLLGGMTLAALLWWLRETSAQATTSLLPSSRTFVRWSLLGLALLGLQIVLGAWVSASFAALACTSFPGCHGVWWPSLASWTELDPFRALPADGLASANRSASLAALHMAHRIMALVVAIYWLVFALRVATRVPACRALALTIFALLILQVVLGVTAVMLSLPLPLVLAHNALAALLLLASVSLATRLTSHAA